MSAASEKAADKMHADLERMRLDAARYQVQCSKDGDANAAIDWAHIVGALSNAMRKSTACMGERDRRIASGT